MLFYCCRNLNNIINDLFVNFNRRNILLYFKNLLNILRQMNYNEVHGEKFNQYREELDNILAQNGN